MSNQYITSIGLYYKEVGRLWRVSDCEEIVGQLPSLSLILQFSTTIIAAKLVDRSFSTSSCIDSPIPKPDINFTKLLNWYSIRSLQTSASKSTGNDRYVIKKVSGHKTDSAFQRYILVTEDEIGGIKWLDKKTNSGTIDTYMDT